MHWNELYTVRHHLAKSDNGRTIRPSFAKQLCVTKNYSNTVVHMQKIYTCAAFCAGVRIRSPVNIF